MTTARGMPTSAHSCHSTLVAPSMGEADAARVRRGDDEQRGVRGPQAGAQLTDEVGVPGGVDAD